MSFGLSIIVKNGARTLQRALEPFAGVADEIVAVDTGSTDETVSILEAFGARVVGAEWRDDFGAARNTALDHAAADWFLSIDADEWVSCDDAQKLRDLTTGAADAFVIDTMNFLTSRDESTLPTRGDDRTIAPYYTVSSKIRLARRGKNGTALRWEGAVHELLDYAAERSGYVIERAPVVIRHDGFFGKSASGYYEDLCRKSLRDGTAHPGIITTLGVIAISRNDAVHAERLFREAMAKAPRFDRPVIWLGRLLHRLGRSDEAVALLLAGMKTCPPSAELTCVLIEVLADIGDEASGRIFIDVARRLFPSSPWLERVERRIAGPPGSR